MLHVRYPAFAAMPARKNFSMGKSMERVGPERIAFRGHLIEIVHQDYSLAKGPKTFEIARRGPGARLIVVGEEGILLTREFRREIGGYDLRLPGGKVFETLAEYQNARESNQPMVSFAAEAARRELAEETGYTVLELDLLGVSRCGAIFEWDLYYFLCNEWLPPGADFRPNEDEDIRVEWTARHQAAEMCLDGRISEERSAIHILRLFRALQGNIKNI